MRNPAPKLPDKRTDNKSQPRNYRNVTRGSLNGPDYDERASHRQDQDLLVQCIAELASRGGTSEALQQVLELLRERVWLAHAAIYSLTTNEQELYCIVESSVAAPTANTSILIEPGSPLARAIKTREPVCVSHAGSESKDLSKATYKSEYIVPLMIRSKLCGVLRVCSDAADGIEGSARALVDQFGLLAALAVDMNSRNRDLLQKELLQSQKIYSLGMLAGGEAHDFNNVLEVIMGFASLARMRLGPADPLHEPLKIIDDSAHSAAALASQLLEISREDEAEAKLVDVTDVLDGVLKIISRTFDRKIRIERRTEQELPCVKGFAHRLEQAVLNLCINARDAMHGAGLLVLEASSENLCAGDSRLRPSYPPGPYVRITIHDTGSGIDPGILAHIFEPQFTTKGPGQGSGLGLTMVDRIIKDAHGYIAVKSTPGEGTEFSLYLPAVLSARKAPAEKASKNLVPGRGTVLVVDDEPRVLEFLEKGLTRLGYTVLSAETGRRACEIYTQQAEKIHCVLLDMIMPEMNGLETYARLRDIDPGVRVILSSGYSSGSIRRETAQAGGAEFLGKPYTLEALSHALQKPQQN